MFGEAEEALKIGYILVGSEVIISLFFAVFIMVVSERLEVNLPSNHSSERRTSKYSTIHY